MLTLIRMEISKIVHNKWAIIIGLVFGAAYILLTYSYYRWNVSIAWESMTLFPYSFGAVMEGVILLVALPACITQEYQSNTEALLLSSKHGRSKLMKAKITASLLIVTFVVVGCLILNAAVNVWFAGWTGWDWPLQKLNRYANSPYELLIWQYALVQALTNWLGCLVFGLFILFVSARSQSYLTVFFIAGIVFVLPFFVRNTSDLSVPWLIKNLPMTDFMRVENIYNRERFVLVYNWMLSLPYQLFYVYMAILAAAFAKGAYGAFRRRADGSS
ncbi:ABC transporter permease [Paenibacillus spongiae]|uniref:ABC transporter permease subunit n=1 Tax=Paenibacillus spongiae TaxID=2909671 RepID=A0ABY5S3B0_9BACL|nr:hypothetical protein [Paenibacillus spongiae]UVI28382.1 hypothetical protein L1F29_23415 [Paenibacillus spongiae]